ncbi:protease complex subunit PrcB family protein [Flavobacterium sp. NRK F10]|uniref:protease complex subunit PrcB family protein n=1 Tax=Flavobacterium sp. NRK F10 TaxID=2954931 RepID=UPI0020912F25|nr:protease complex subunit PrcB family protein [Flavobacterium sp. NRK F10]MCO6176196.1 protease complex subunit PrcB family protein [Flavobacterium sp. NRK F10]
MKKILFLIAFMTLVSCNTTKQFTEGTDYTYIIKNSTGGNEKASVAIIDNYNDLINEVDKLNISDAISEALLNVDLEQNNVLVLHLGQRNSGGYGIEIEKMYEKKNILYIKTKEIKPGKGDMVTMALTNPFTIVLIPKKEVVIE